MVDMLCLRKRKIISLKGKNALLIDRVERLLHKIRET